MGISSELIGIILGALIAGFFALIQAFKKDNVQYITSERTKWRDTIREIIIQLGDSTPRNIGGVLIELKENINSYGIYPSGSYPADGILDYQKDEHIWKVIDEIENGTYNGDFEKLKNQLIGYLTLLLKFEWERHKVEVKGNTYILKSIGVFFIPYIFTFFYKIDYVNLSSIPNIIQSITNTNLYKILFIQLGLYIIFLLIMSFIRHFDNYRKWYKSQYYVIIFGIIAGIALTLNILSCFDRDIKTKQEINFSSLPEISLSLVSIFISYFLVLISTHKRKKLYLDYDLAIRRVFFDEKIYIYYKPKFILLDMWLDICRRNKFDNIFNKYNVGFYKEVIKHDFSFDSVLSDNNCIVGTDFRILNLCSYFKFKFKTKQKSIFEFIKENPKRCKMVIRYTKNNNEFYCISNKKDDWEKFLKKHLNITDNN